MEPKNSSPQRPLIQHQTGHHIFRCEVTSSRAKRHVCTVVRFQVALRSTGTVTATPDKRVDNANAASWWNSLRSLTRKRTSLYPWDAVLFVSTSQFGRLAKISSSKVMKSRYLLSVTSVPLLPAPCLLVAWALETVLTGRSRSSNNGTMVVGDRQLHISQLSIFCVWSVWSDITSSLDISNRFLKSG